MKISDSEYVGTWDELAAHAHEFVNKRLHITVLPDLASERVCFDSEEPKNATDRQASIDKTHIIQDELFSFPPDSIEAKILAIAARIPKEELDKLPPDLSDRFDYYLYGDPS